MTKVLSGQLVELDGSGVGLVEVPDHDELVYFRAQNIRGYKGETVKELYNHGRGWSAGTSVNVAADLDPDGHVRAVEWVELA